MKSFLTEENTEFLETKLVDILDEFQLSDNRSLTIVKEKQENSLILVTSKMALPFSKQPATVPKKLQDWTILPFDLGGHSPYFCSQKIFSSSSSFYFLTFSRYENRK